MSEVLHGIYIRFWNETDNAQGRVGAHVELWDSVKERMRVVPLHTIDFPALYPEAKQFLGDHLDAAVEMSKRDAAIDYYQSKVAALVDLIPAATDDEARLPLDFVRSIPVASIDLPNGDGSTKVVRLVEGNKSPDLFARVLSLFKG
jgi:hypothetical protein